MSAGQTAEDVLHEKLRTLGYKETKFRTETGRIWVNGVVKRHILVPDSCDGFYPRFIFEMIEEQAARVGAADVAKELKNIDPYTGEERTIQ